MDSIITTVRNYAQSTERRLGQLYDLSSDMPDGNLFIKHTQKDADYYYSRWQDKKARHNVYIPKNDLTTITKLADKSYLNAVIPKLESNLRAADLFLSEHSGFEEYDLEQLITPDVLSLCSDTCLDRRVRIDKWLSETWTETPYSDIPPMHQTHKGPMVRSKSEVIISNALFARGIPYLNEKPLYYAKNKPPIFPDLTIMHPQTCEIWYWEHFGMIGDPNYAVSVCKKLTVYMSMGLTPGHGLICTFECEGAPLSSVMVDKLIRFYFGR